VYAIAFDVNTAAAEAVLGDGWKTCYGRIQNVLNEHGFENVQGSLYFGSPESNSVSCVMAVQALDDRFSWFSKIIRDLRMFRIDENNDLLPVLGNRLRFDQSKAS
jgi:virulence-associated protein VapD